MIDARDYAFDWTNTHSSVAAMTSIIAQCNTEKMMADFTNCQGAVGLDGFCGVWMAGTGPVGPLTAPPGGQHAADYTNAGVTFAMRKPSGMASGVGAVDPWCRFHSKSACFNINFTQPDQVTSGIDAGSDPDAYDASVAAALLDPDNAPDTYPPVIVTDHLLSDAGTATTPATRSKFAGGRFEGLVFSGLYQGAFLCHEVGADFDPANAATGQQQATSFSFDAIGYCLKNDLTIGNSGSTSTVVWLASPVLYVPWAQEGGIGAVHRALRWALENKESVVLRNRAVGLTAKIGTRVARHGLVIRGGWTADPTTDAYRGQSSGRVNQSEITVGVEQVATEVKVEFDGYFHGAELTVSGRANNKFRTDLVTPAFDIQTDRDKAGAFNKTLGLIPLADIEGATFNLYFKRGALCMGEWLRVASTDGLAVINVNGSLSSWGSGGDGSSPCFNLEDGCRAILRPGAMTLNAGVGQNFFRVPSKDQLSFTAPPILIGGINPPIVNLPEIDHSDVFVFPVGTRWLQEGFQANASDLDDEEDDS